MEINEDYKELYCDVYIYFLLKLLHIDIKSDCAITTDKLVFAFPPNIDIYTRDCAYRPSVYDIFKYIEENFNFKISINKQNEKWEWLVLDLQNKPIIYSGETKTTNVAYNCGKNIPENREYFDSEIDAVNDALTEFLIWR